MACKCKEDKEVLPNGIIIGKNKVVCDECKALQIIEEKKQRQEQIQMEIQSLENSNSYKRSMREVILYSAGSEEWNEASTNLTKVEEAIEVLRQEYKSLE